MGKPIDSSKIMSGSLTDDEEHLSQKRSRRHRDFDSEDEKAIKLLLYQDTRDNVYSQTHRRFNAATKFKFLKLLCCSNYSSFETDFLDHLMRKLQENHGELFDCPQLKSLNLK